MQLCQRLYQLLKRFPRRAPAPPHINVQFHDPLLSRDLTFYGRVLCIKAFVRENSAKREWLGNHDCRRWCSRKFECAPGNSRFDAEKEVRSKLNIGRCGTDWCLLRLGFIKLAIREGFVFHFVAHVFHVNVDLLVRISYRCFRLARTMYVHFPATELGAPKIERYQIYEQMPNEKGTTLYKIQKKFQNVFGFTLPLFHGRGILNCE